MKLRTLVGSLAVLGLATHAGAQTVPSSAPQRVEITGSSIKRLASETALPIEIISRAELSRQGIASTEQLIMQLNINGNGLDNLASNADVVAGAGRGNNGASSANLRGQGSNATLILLNGRRVAAHGLNGGTVDLNHIPFAALDRVEILKDGASAIYGTDAIGGVINFILRTNYQGATIDALVDVPQQKGGEIYGASVVAGFGDLDRQRFNVMAALSVRDHKKLRGDQRDFVNTNQPLRGVSADTRGTPLATVFAVAGTQANVLSRDNIDNAGRGTGPLDFAVPNLRVNGINPLDLPGQAGCASVDGMAAYDEALWATPASKYGCNWDTGRAAVIQQPVTNTSLVARATLRLGDSHQIYAEAILGKSESAKSFSNNQITSGNATANTSLPNGAPVPSPFRDLRYPSTGASYNEIFNKLVAAFPAIEANRGRPIAFRWRCMACGPRELETESNSARYLLAGDGTLPWGGGDWDYRFGFNQATNESESTVGSGYHYWQPFAQLINTGVLNPFTLNQTPQAMAALQAIEARGVTLYGGKSTVTQVDAGVSGPLFQMPGGRAMMALGLDSRTEKFKFQGDLRSNANTVEALIFNVPFDNILATGGTLKRDVRAVFGEILLPVLKNLELTAAVRQDDYTGFGKTTNPKVSMKYTPFEALMVRGAYSTGFRVPTFKQQFDPATISAYAGNDYTDPAKCPTRVVDATKPGCEIVKPDIVFGGKTTLGPEEAKMSSLGMVFQLGADWSGNIDWWSIERTGTIQSFDLTTLSTAKNYPLFAGNFFRDAAGTLLAVDTRFVNAGATVTKGLEFGVKGNFRSEGGVRWLSALDVSYLLEKKSKLLANADFGPSEVGVFSRATDLGIRWKHTASITRVQGDWAATLAQLYRGGYADYVIPGIANGSVKPVDWNYKVSPYEVFNVSVAYNGFKNMTLVAGIKNVFNEAPPFSVTYDTDTGAGSSWEPRVADPRGRAFTLRAEYRF